MAVLLAAVMLLGTMPAALAANAAKPGDRSFDDHGVRLDKQASALDGSWKTKINLTVESVSEQTPVAVEFVLDGTSSLYTGTEGVTIARIAEEARKALYNKNAYMGITVFGRDVVKQNANDITTLKMDKVSATTVASDNQLLATVVSQLTTRDDLVGTNIQAGIEAGLADLATAPANALKYLVLVTDGGSYWWNENGTPVNNTVNGQPMQNSDAADGGYTAANGSAGQLATLQSLLAMPEQEAAEKLTAKDYLTGGEALAEAVRTIKEDPDQYTSFEKGVYHAAEAVNDIPGDVDIIVVSRDYYKDQQPGLSDLAKQFITHVKGQDNCVASANLTEAGINSVMDLVTDTASTVIRQGSTITDLLGDSKYDAAVGHTDADASYNYDLVDTAGFTLNIGGQNLTSTRSGNTWTFSDGSKLVWSGLGDREYFELTLGADLKIGEKLILSYTAVLSEKDTSVGDHITYPNVQAYLTPLNDTEHLLFPEPVRDYRVGDGGGGGGGGTVIKPEPVPGGDKPQLNTTDHYAYIIGRKDGLVHPEAQITRAEVATIFFRMLTDESRNELWSQSNPYSDITPDMWCNAAISTMTRAGVIEGFQDGTFRPYAPITRAQFATIAVRFFEVTYAGDDKFSDIAGHWAADYINKAAEAAIIAGFQDGTFRPNTYITRAQAMTIFNRVLGRAPEKDHLLPGMITWPDNLNTSAWYYATMQEATNSHEYDRVTAADGTVYEVWTKLLPVRDWAAFEKEWSDSNSAANPGEVISAVVLDK
ncbi:S-layer homology domain-containing protein [Dysosmobacter sp.]|uniref:S-layer homology domain-containing protein n=1 Tax=Dysosmobacter sp. TaxID=2591382 RepID=UPI002D7E9CF0|nr:S-layer homology domain-containing protein [Dysosmobacter sp.]